MALTKDQIREKLMNFGKKVVNFDGILPGLEDLAGELAMRELSAADLSDINKMASSGDSYDNALDGGISIARGLITQAGERIFSDTDAQAIADFGLSITKPIMDKIKEISGLSKEAVKDQKKVLPTPQPGATNASVIESTATVEPLAQDSQSDNGSTTSQEQTS